MEISHLRAVIRELKARPCPHWAEHGVTRPMKSCIDCLEATLLATIRVEIKDWILAFTEGYASQPLDRNTMEWVLAKLQASPFLAPKS